MRSIIDKQKSYCMNCRNEVNENTKKCECGGTFFVFGDNFHFNKEGIVCNCGCHKFNRFMHLDYKDKSVNNFACNDCGNSIGTESYRDKEDMMYWID